MTTRKFSFHFCRKAGRESLSVSIPGMIPLPNTKLPCGPAPAALPFEWIPGQLILIQHFSGPRFLGQRNVSTLFGSTLSNAFKNEKALSPFNPRSCSVTPYLSPTNPPAKAWACPLGASLWRSPAATAARGVLLLGDVNVKVAYLCVLE
jgi:hypothetical protein